VQATAGDNAPRHLRGIPAIRGAEITGHPLEDLCAATFSTRLCLRHRVSVSSRDAGGVVGRLRHRGAEVLPQDRGGAGDGDRAKTTQKRVRRIHKESRKLVDQYGLIDFGNTSPSKLAKTTMAESVLDGGWAGPQALDFV
jgi:hypothetical protein